MEIVESKTGVVGRSRSVVRMTSVVLQHGMGRACHVHFTLTRRWQPRGNRPINDQGNRTSVVGLGIRGIDLPWPDREYTPLDADHIDDVVSWISRYRGSSREYLRISACFLRIRTSTKWCIHGVQ